jgi:hypothetical protein
LVAVGWGAGGRRVLVGLGRGVILVAAHDRLQLCVFAGQVAKLVLVGDHARIGQQACNFLVAIEQMVQFVQYRVFQGRKISCS